MRAEAAIRRLLDRHEFGTVLDVGSGPGLHAQVFRAAGKLVTTTDLRAPCDVPGDFADLAFGAFDVVWCSHVLEHQRNVGVFLEKCQQILSPRGLLAVTVPPMKPEIVGGHLTLWNAGLLLYNLVLAGFDCSAAEVLSEGYDVSVIVRRSDVDLPELRMDAGDIETLAPYFPVPVQQGFDGFIRSANWR